jgi:hypothetical protein
MREAIAPRNERGDLSTQARIEVSGQHVEKPLRRCPLEQVNHFRSQLVQVGGKPLGALEVPAASELPSFERHHKRRQVSLEELDPQHGHAVGTQHGQIDLDALGLRLCHPVSCSLRGVEPYSRSRKTVRAWSEEADPRTPKTPRRSMGSNNRGARI